VTAGWALRTAATLEEANEHFASLEAAGLLGMVEARGATTLYFPDRVTGLPVDGTWEPVPEQDWNAAWMATFTPVTVGVITVVAPWHERPADGVPLVVEPAQAFGTGHHETTTRCLLALQAVPLAGRRVLDVGTGSGILALAAKALGAGTVVGTDVDEVAIAAARVNAEANGLDVAFEQGSADRPNGERFDVVLANLDTATLSALAGDLAACLAPSATLIASGVSNERIDEAVAALTGAGLRVEASAGREWALLTAQG